MEKESKNSVNKNSPYQDIINLPHPISANHEPMTIYNRAAQFSPFAALTGFEGVIKETARLTDHKVELDEAEKEMLDKKLRIIKEQSRSIETQAAEAKDRDRIAVTYFKPDERKEGGVYVTEDGIVKKIDPNEQVMIMSNGSRIPLEDIVDMSGDIFKIMDEY